MNANKISNTLIDTWKEHTSITKGLEEKIVDRIDYVLHQIAKVYHCKLDYWYFYGAEEGEVGSLAGGIDEENDLVSVVTNDDCWNNCCDDELCCILNNEEEYYFGDGFPYRWLFEDFEEELIEGRKRNLAALKAREAAKKEKKAKSKAEVNKALKKAKSKLSPYEMTLLKNHLKNE